MFNINIEFADKIDAYVDELIDDQRDKYIEKIDKLTQDVNNWKQELLKEKEISKYQSEIRKSLYLIRQYLNYKFRTLWDELPQNIKNKYDPCLGDILNRKHILEDNGVKYALLILNNIHNGATKKLCKYYLELNDTFHPNFKPEKIIIHDCIEKLKKFSIATMDVDILNEIDKLCLAT